MFYIYTISSIVVLLGKVVTHTTIDAIQKGAIN